MMEVTALPALRDNYIWLLHGWNTLQAIVVDPGDAQVVEHALTSRRLELAAILLTHHHPDHTAGVIELAQRHRCRVIGPRDETIAGVTERVADADHVQIGQLRFDVMDVRGHTSGHVAYWCETYGLVFCGDVLFGAGCGRINDGTPAQFWSALRKLASLPRHTRVYCGHEYTLANLHFARAVEPDNLAIADREQRDARRVEQDLPTLPTTIDIELRTNPFLRALEPSIQRRCDAMASEADIAAQLQRWTPIGAEERNFAILRAWKNVFR